MTDNAELEEIEIRAGEVLFKEGDLPDNAYIVRSGLLEVFKTKRHKKIALGIARDNDIVGEMSLIDNKPRTATVRALDNSMLVVLSRDKLLAKIGKADRVTRHLLMKFISIIRRMDDQLSNEVTKIK